MWKIYILDIYLLILLIVLWIFRPLKAEALVIQVPEIDPHSLLDRSMNIAKREGLRIDRYSAKQLVERSGCDIRSCLGALQYMGGIDHNKNSTVGIKDMRTGLFDTWRELFQVPYDKCGVVCTRDRFKRVLKLSQQGEKKILKLKDFHFSRHYSYFQRMPGILTKKLSY